MGHVWKQNERTIKSKSCQIILSSLGVGTLTVQSYKAWSNGNGALRQWIQEPQRRFPSHQWLFSGLWNRSSWEEIPSNPVPFAGEWYRWPMDLCCGFPHHASFPKIPKVGSILCTVMWEKHGKTRRNHPFGNGLYHPFKWFGEWFLMVVITIAKDNSCQQCRTLSESRSPANSEQEEWRPTPGCSGISRYFKILVQ